MNVILGIDISSLYIAAAETLDEYNNYNKSD